MAEVVEVAELPKCNWCCELAEYDFKTSMGPWGNGCQEHYVAFRAYGNLGTGRGQRLVVPEGDGETRREKDRRDIVIVDHDMLWDFS